MKSERHALTGRFCSWQKERLRSCTSIIVLGLALGMGNVAQAQESRVNVPAMPLNEALTQLGYQTGLQFLFEPSLVSGKRSVPVSGNMEPSTALETMLKNANLTYRIENDTVILSSPKGSASGATLELGATSVVGQGMGESTEHSGSYTPGLTSVGSKTPMSLRETPQSVSVITAQALKDRQITGLGDAMRATPGITVKNFNYRMPRYYSRGFEIKNIQIDGASSLDANGGYSNQLYNLAEFDHIEVLRGSAGLFGGVGDPGGIINLVRKRPLDHYQLKFDASAGSWDNYRTQVDVTGPLAFDGALRGRLVAAYNDRQYFMDNRGTENPTVYGVLEADLTPDTMITLGGRLEKNKETGTGDGLPFYSDGKSPNYSRSYWPTTTWSYSDHSSNELFFKLDHYFSDDWKFNTSLTHVFETVESQGAFIYGNIDRADGSGPYWAGSYQRAKTDQTVLDMNLSGKFDMLGREHELLIGADAQSIRARWRAADGMSGRFGPATQPWVEGTMDKEFWRDYSPNKQKQYGLYSTLRLQLADPLKLIVGARATRYKYDQVYSTKDRVTDVWSVKNIVDYREPTKVVPFGGLVYDLNEEWSTYVSYSEIFNPQAKSLAGPQPGTSLDPMEGKTYETGVKGELWDGAVNVSAALFYSERENQATPDPRYAQQVLMYGGSCCYLPRGKVTSKGIDLEISGELLPNWQVMAGYTYNRNEDRTNSAIFSSVTPKHLAKFWSTYVLPGELSDWKVGGGATIQSANFVSGEIEYSGVNEIPKTQVEMSQGGYAVWDAMLEYKVDSHWTVAFNANNLFDRKYYDTLTHPDYANYYGTPRNYMLTLRGVWD
ncbi:TonB-dependent siderophore receptor [Pseudomonas auratipiscis]|uniref:TonB-dependent siderophore receptor n=1 Tax=Pseudomonas auratipiscis TaxID=3115853 RepID=A0AB35WQI3_9PSED|nr:MULTISPECIES: TonB-dependent siderophore receptor [unclassified Pseudomonas]MEE1866828.1 TonB-dependent siderophore receptor [Pseudomonas sp. 120P]MEE1958724.1 TonB-dependent siderophore receptor [Pseudomonas sp. 119P]